jgi:hypothetical protein
LADVLYPYNANTSDWRGNTWYLPYTQTTPMPAPIFMAQQPAKFYVSTTYAGRMFFIRKYLLSFHSRRQHLRRHVAEHWRV